MTMDKFLEEENGLIKKKFARKVIVNIFELMRLEPVLGKNDKKRFIMKK